MKKNLLISIYLVLIFSNISYAEFEKPAVNASSAIAIDTVTGRILYEKNGFSKKPMASTTKVMTAIVAVEENSLKDIVTVSKNAASVGGSSAHLKANQKIMLSELLYGLMLNSGNDASVAIAEHTSGSVEEFIKLMNKKAVEIGAFNTNFVTPHGLDSANHYSTAYDMAIISAYAIRNPIISELVSTREKHMVFMDGTGVNLKNTNNLLTSYPNATGIKTGYTGMAGRCLIGSAKSNGWEVVTVVFGEPTSSSRLNDTVKILNYCFNNYKFVNLNDLYVLNTPVSILKGTRENIMPIYLHDLFVPLTEVEKGAITVRKEILSEIIAPVSKNTTVGKIEFILNDSVIGSVPIVTDSDIPRVSTIDYYKLLVQKFLKLSPFS